jgi:hypothetical protein
MRGNPKNLTHGKRVLRFDVKFANQAQIEKSMLSVVQNFDRDLRNEIMNDATVMLEARAVHYIREGKKESRVPRDNPRSQGLEHSFRSFFHETDSVQVTMGEGISYARIHNLPIGQTRTIVPHNGKWLLFRWYRLDKKSRIAARSVEKPGIAFWDRALDDVRKNMKKLMAKKLKELTAMGRTDIFLSTGAHVKRGPRLRNNAKVRSMRYD